MTITTTMSSSNVYPDDLGGALELLTAFPGTRYYDDFASDYPSVLKASTMPLKIRCSTHCGQSTTKCESGLLENFNQSQIIYDKIAGKKSNERTLEEESPRDQSPCPSIFPTEMSRNSVSRCGAWDTLGSLHAWGTGFTLLPSRTLPLQEFIKHKQLSITTMWERMIVYPEDKDVLTTPLNISTIGRSSVVLKSIGNTISCAGSGLAGNLISVAAGSYVYDLLTMPPIPGADCPEEARKLYSLALGSTSRSAFVLLMASDHVTLTAALFRGTASFKSAIRTGSYSKPISSDHFVFSMPSSMHKPKEVKILPLRLSGIARDPTFAFNKAIEHVGPRGCIGLPTPFSFTIGYDVGMYGPSIGSVFATMDTSFLYDYSVAVQSPQVQAILERCFPKVYDNFKGETMIESHIKTVAPLIWANYEAVSYKSRLEDQFCRDSEPCAIVWKNLSILAAYRLVDGAFMHAWYDSDMSAESIAMAGLGLAMHDLFDMSKDISEGEVANTVPSLTNGDLSLNSLAALYSRVGAILRWQGTNMPDEPAGLCILLTFWWQMGNMRHRIVQAVNVVDPSERAQIPRVTSIDHRPVYEDYAVGDVHDPEEIWQAEREILTIPDISNPNLSPTMAALGSEVVLPYGLCAEDLTAIPPADHICAAKVMAVLSMGLDSSERAVLWEWMSYLWDSGACWSSILGTLCYRKPQSDAKIAVKL